MCLFVCVSVWLQSVRSCELCYDLQLSIGVIITRRRKICKGLKILKIIIVTFSGNPYKTRKKIISQFNTPVSNYLHKSADDADNYFDNDLYSWLKNCSFIKSNGCIRRFVVGYFSFLPWHPLVHVVR